MWDQPTSVLFTPGHQRRITFLSATVAFGPKGFRNYVGFSGRASRSEFWYWVLFTVLVGIVTSIIDLGVLPSSVNPFSSIWSLVTFLPSLAMGIRRLHHTYRSGWWSLLTFIPLIGIIVLSASTASFLALIGIIVLIVFWFS